MPMPRLGGLTVNDNGAVADCDVLSVTFNVKLLVPAAVGVPDIVPPEIFKPAGSDPPASDQEKGGVPPPALSAWE